MAIRHSGVVVSPAHLGQVEHFSVFCRNDENLGIVVHRVNLAISGQSEKNAICTCRAK